MAKAGRKASPGSLPVSFPAIRKLPFLYVHLEPTLLLLLPFYFTPIAVNPARSLGGIRKAALLSAACVFSSPSLSLRSSPQVYFSLYRSMHVIIFISHKKTALRRRQYSLLSRTCVRAYGNDNPVYVLQLRIITGDCVIKRRTLYESDTTKHSGIPGPLDGSSFTRNGSEA